jgi:hypothetical protein
MISSRLASGKGALQESAILLANWRGRGLALIDGMNRGAKKNPHAMALGRLGGLKGGRARAEKLSARRRREIARQAAVARWNHRHRGAIGPTAP